MDSVKSTATTARQRMDRRNLLWPVFVSGLVVLGVVPFRTVAGHGYMTEPRSRAEDHLKGDVKGWPIAGVPPRLTRVPCLDLPVNNKFTEVQPGPLQLKFFYGDGANHVGLCQVFLLDPKDPAHKVKIAEMMDCARSDHPGPGHKGEDLVGHMTVTIPATVPCDPTHCVLQWIWIATHRSVTRPEYYDNCADLRISGAHQADNSAAASPAGPQRPVDQGLGTAHPAPLVAAPPAFAAGEDAVRRMIAYAMTSGDDGNAEAIMAEKRQIEALPLDRHVEPGAHLRARAANERGLQVLHDGDMAEAVQAFKTAYELAPTDVEIVNNFGYAYLRHNDPEAAEAWLLLTLVLSPERVNGWVNLGEAYARQGQPRMAVACLANGYRFSKNPTATRRFLQNLSETEDEDEAVRQAARQTLQLPLLQAGKG
ncbi:MAG TPA: tetratricopeptide repeat protein [Steroidobacteraceae bacterium]